MSDRPTKQTTPRTGETTSPSGPAGGLVQVQTEGAMPAAGESPALCGCLRCQDERRQAIPLADKLENMIARFPGMDPYFRYACEVCGNKRCPHHSDHGLACTNSNAVGQPGSVYQ